MKTDTTTTPARADGTVPALVGLLLRWYYGYHKAIDANKADSGDAAIKPHFLAICRDTENVLGPMRDAGTLTDEQCHAAFVEANAEVHGRRSRTVQPLVGHSSSEGGRE